MRTLRRASVLLLVAVVVLLVVADRLTEQAASRAVAVKVRSVALLAGDPSVSIRGFPFLTQALRGRYAEIDVTIHGIHRGGLRLDTVTGRFRGVHLGLREALAGQVVSVPVEHASGAVSVTYADLDTYLASRHVTVRAEGGSPRPPLGLAVAGSATVGGRRIAVSGPVTVMLSAGTLVIAPVAAALRGPAGLLPAASDRVVAAALTARIPLGQLPFGLTLRSLTVGPTALSISADAAGLAVVVPPGAARS